LRAGKILLVCFAGEYVLGVTAHHGCHPSSAPFPFFSVSPFQLFLVPPQDPDQARWFAAELQPHEPMLRAWLKSRFPHETDVDDILQESYLRVLAAREHGGMKSPKAFLFATARNLAVDRARRRQIVRTDSLVETDALSVLDESDGIPETIARNQELEFLTAAIQLLPDRCRRIFTLRKVYGLSQADIARKLGVSEYTVSAQLTIGVHKCTEYMRRYRKDCSP
jgi:RNA polymerase sigma-70 factor (ECF subfamily)